ncbi:hypothetical protein OQA88_9842 [Cercophora sp. LCS_1]
MESAQRKIELQSHEDLSYLIANVRRAAADSINAAFPPVEGTDGQEDELRTRIEQMVDDYINQTFTLASPNLSINGMPVDPAHFLSSSSSDLDAPQEQIEYEPFDPRKRYRIEDLAREEEELLRSIASLKRRLPATTAAAYANALKAGVSGDEAALEAAKTKVEAEGALSGRKAVEGVGSLDRQDEVEIGYQKAIETLGRLKREMPAAVAKMERARVAGGYVATEL